MKVCSACKRCFDDTAESCVEFGHPKLPDPGPGHREMVTGYSLDQVVAASNKADVYLARRIDCDKRCMIKVVSADIEDGKAFLRDAGLAAALFDARVVDVYEAGTLESGQYFVVEAFDEGQTLRRHLDVTGTPDLLDSIRIVEQVAEALHALHLQGLTHGAVRPGNILLSFDEEGRPAVTLSSIDLGGVVARNIISNKFVIDSALDSIRYFAPEQCSGMPACPQTDVYSLGVVLYELLAGVPPFDAPKAVALMDMHKTQRPPEVMIDDLDLRMLVAHSLSESLQKQPSFRQCSADLLARQMRHIEQLATHVSTPPPAVSVPTAPSVPLNAAPIKPSRAHLPAVEPPTHDSVGTAYARAVDTTTEPQIEPAVTTIVPIAAYDDVDEFQVVDEAAAGYEEPVYLDCEAAPEIIPEHAGPIDITEVESPLFKASALAERRHRLRLSKKNLGPVEERPFEASAEPELNPENDLISRLGPSVAFDLSHPAEEVKAEPTIMPKLIQWDQPDDIPSIDDVEVESSAQLPAFEQPFSVSIAERGSAPVTESRHLINWEQPEDDIPSIEDVIDARSQEAVPAVHAIHFEPEDSAVVAVIKRPRSAESDEPSTAQVSEAAIGSVPRKAIDIDFFPTILGEKSRHEDARPRPQYTSILNAYDTPQAARSVPYRSISIGVVLMAVAAVIGLGGDPLWRYFTAPEPDRSIAEVPNKEERIPTQSMRSAMVEPAASDSEQAAASFNEIPSYDGPASASTAERPRPDAPKARSRRQARSGTVTNEAVRGKNTPIEPSTLVITYGNGGVKSANSAQKVSREKESRPTGDRPAGATRPRIVANPQ